MRSSRRDRLMSGVASLVLAVLLAAPGQWMLRGLIGTTEDGANARRTPARAYLVLGGGTVVFLGGSVVLGGLGVWTLVSAARKPSHSDDQEEE